MTLTALLALASTPLAPIVVGIVGSAIEKIGLAGNWPRVTAVGKVLEAIASDFPKAVANVKAAVTGKPVQ